MPIWPLFELNKERERKKNKISHYKILEIHKHFDDENRTVSIIQAECI